MYVLRIRDGPCCPSNSSSLPGLLTLYRTTAGPQIAGKSANRPRRESERHAPDDPGLELLTRQPRGRSMPYRAYLPTI